MTLKLMHVALHDHANMNAGDTMLSHATRQCFEHFLCKRQGHSIDWTLKQLWEPFDAGDANKHDAIIVGGGGLLLPDQEGADYSASGWQWNCTLEQLEKIKAPLVLFGIGWNLFRGQEGFNNLFGEHFDATVKKAVFIGMREREPTGAKLPKVFAYQPCPTTLISMIYDDLPEPAPIVGNVGFNAATDRWQFRFKDASRGNIVLKNLAFLAKRLYKFHQTITVLTHKPEDDMLDGYLNAIDVPHEIVKLEGEQPKGILEAYQGIDMVIGMRSHSQLIPFGLNKRILSVISHEKLARFLDDIDHPEWGVDVDVTEFRKTLFEKCMLLEDVTLQDMRDAQLKLYDITARNMQYIESKIWSQ